MNLCLIDEVTWIPVENEVPEYEDMPVLFWIDGAGCCVGTYSQKGLWFDIYGHPISSGVNWWAPFPKGPNCTLLIALQVEWSWE